MDTLSFKTISVNKETAKKEWVVIDATAGCCSIKKTKKIS